MSRDKPQPWCVWCAREIWGVDRCRKHGGVRVERDEFQAVVNLLAEAYK